MSDETEPDRLSQIKTLWTQMLKVGVSPNQPDAKTKELVLRYYDAVYRYLLSIVREEDKAMDLTQEFAVRFVRGDFSKANPARGRFRDFLKASVRNLVMDHYRKQKVARDKGLGQMPDEGFEPADDRARAAQDAAFAARFRDEILTRTWATFAEYEKSSGKPVCTVLRFRTENPEANTTEMAATLSCALGREISEVAMRQTLSRARAQFADLLLDEVRQTLASPSHEELHEELVELGLLEYCKSALERRQQK
jgi:RNA polymerase sigma factor (sigma-70 family)